MKLRALCLSAALAFSVMFPISASAGWEWVPRLWAWVMSYAEPKAELVTATGQRIIYARGTINVASFIRTWLGQKLNYGGVPVTQILIQEAWGASKVVVYTINGWVPFQYETTPQVRIIKR